ncbi:hypothetical protein Hoch_0733 [Haliangium ochraceum DSM 14365]|uniref:eCIS core domain-containing protein n=1 Tax=Haliangium ochraceum (strain DSM 14365 / JCM 11303 / SMP-2) TaxID=502025 RepID=D0LMY8_HALO1|nr:hypothetical protein Hoch_0733 [Haliangium ochraceum DSM 14365]
MGKDWRRRGGPGQTGGGDSQRPSRPTPGKVTRTSKLRPPGSRAAQSRQPVLAAGRPPTYSANDLKAPFRANAEATAPGRLPYRAEMERAFGEDFSDVEVRYGGASEIDANAVATQEGGQDTVMFERASPSREQVAHELTHVVQRRRHGPGPARLSRHDDPAEQEARDIATRAAAGESVQVDMPPGGTVQRDDAVDDVAARIHANLHAIIDDEPAALAELQSDPHVSRTCATYRNRYRVTLWADFIDNASGSVLRDALALLWPHMSVLERLSTQLGWDDDEDGILQIIDSASDKELRAAPRSEIEVYLDELDAPDQYRARQRIWPEEAIDNVIWLLEHGDGWLWDDEGPATTAILSLSPAQRATLWNEHPDAFGMFSKADKARIQRMCIGKDGAPATDAQALEARMELATEGAGTDEEGVIAAIGVAGSRRDAQARIDAELAAGIDANGVPLNPAKREELLNRLDEIGDIEGLLTATPGGDGRLDEGSFLGRVQDDMDAGTLDAALATARVDAFTRAKQALLATIGPLGIDVDEDAALAVLRDIQGEVVLADGETIDSLDQAEVQRRQQASALALRKKLRDDAELEPVWRALDGEETAYANALTEGRSYDAAIHELTEAFEGVNIDEAAILRIIRGMSAADRELLHTQEPPILRRIQHWPLLGAEFQCALDAVLKDGDIPADVAFDAAYGGWGDGTDEDIASDALAMLPENERATYRRGYLAVHRGSDAELSEDEQSAAEAYQQLHARMASEYGDEDLDRAIAALIGLPSITEMLSAQGRIEAATIMLERQRERLEMSGGLTDMLTTTDDTASFAYVEFRAHYEQAMEGEGISLEEFSVLVALDEQFNRRFENYADTVDMVSEIAGTVAAVVAGVVVLMVSGGTASAAAPGVLAWVSANSGLIASTAISGAIAQVVTSEAMGGDFNQAASTEGARQALSGALNGALMIAGAALAEKAATLVGLSGRALTAQIARSAAGAVETSVPGRAFARGALTGLIDGSLGGAVGELAMTLTDAETWKRSVWGVLAQAGQALLRGGLIGGGTGMVAGGLLEMAQGLLRARGIRDVAVEMDERLGSGTYIDFAVENDGALRGLTLRFGPQTPDGDLAAHVERIVAIQRTASLLGRARAVLRGSDSFPLDTRAGEVAQELPKLEAMIQDRLRQLRGGNLSPQSVEVVEAELDVLEANLDEFGKVLERGDLSPGTGRIGRPDAPPGYPDPPEGHYYRQHKNGWDLQRYPDVDVEPYTLKPDGAGGWQIVGREGVAPSAARFPEGTSAEDAFEQLVGADSRSSFKQYWEMLRANKLATRKEVIAAMIEPSGRTEDAVRHALKEQFRGRVLQRARFSVDGVARTEAESLAELQRLTAGLNPSDRGSLVEAWYGASRGDLVAHPAMSPEDNPGLADVRRPDFVDGSTLVEVKSTGQGLGQRDVVQVRDMLDVCASDNGRVRLPDGTLRDVTDMRLVFTDIRGARGSADVLSDWLESSEALALEIFGSDRVAIRITQGSLPNLQARHGVDSLAALLEVL